MPVPPCVAVVAHYEQAVIVYEATLQLRASGVEGR